MMPILAQVSSMPETSMHNRSRRAYSAVLPMSFWTTRHTLLCTEKQQDPTYSATTKLLYRQIRVYVL